MLHQKMYQTNWSFASMCGDIRFLFAGPPRVEYIKNIPIITKTLHQKNGSICQKNGWVFDLALCLARASWAQTSPREPRRAQKSTGEPRRGRTSQERAQESPGSPGEPWIAQGSPDEPGRAQTSQEEHRRAQDGPEEPEERP